VVALTGDTIMPSKTTVAVNAESDESYDLFEGMTKSRVSGLAGPVFGTDATPEALWAAYLSGIPAQRRQHYNCHACRRFVQLFGGLVMIDSDGTATPAVWARGAPGFFADVVGAVSDLVSRSKVAGVFLSPEKTWGVADAGGWSHLSGPSPAVYRDRVKTAGQAMAEKREDHGILCRGLADYPRAAVEQAVRVLRADALDRSEKTLGVAEWLAGIQSRTEAAKNQRSRGNILWLAVASAPAGFCHVRSTMISTLLDDVVAGLPYDDIARRWADKMHPLRYQRPTAAPSAGTIEQAERLVERLGVAKSLGRRFATLDDVLSKLWVPPAVQPAEVRAGGVFGHLRPAGTATAPEVSLPAVPMTWDKFSRAVLPAATGIDVAIPAHGGFYGLATAADPDAPPIIQWDGLDGHPRNPASWYFYHGGSPAHQWNLSAGWGEVTAVFYGPHHWQEPSRFAHQGRNVHFAIRGCRDARMKSGGGLCLFPEILKSEFHGIRSVIEAHSRTAGIIGPESGSANGLAFQKGSPVTLRVRSGDGTATYVIDRID
jgi:hypothetical protein